MASLGTHIAPVGSQKQSFPVSWGAPESANIQWQGRGLRSMSTSRAGPTQQVINTWERKSISPGHRIKLPIVDTQPVGAILLSYQIHRTCPRTVGWLYHTCLLHHLKLSGHLLSDGEGHSSHWQLLGCRITCINFKLHKVCLPTLVLF